MFSVDAAPVGCVACVDFDEHGYPGRNPAEGKSVSTPDHAENTGDNLRHAAEVQEQARDDETQTQVPAEDNAPVTPLPDFNT